MKLAAAERRAFIDERINREWGWVDYQKPAPHENPKAYSYRMMVEAIARAFPGQSFNPMTIQRDVALLRKKAEVPDDSELSEAQRLLLPENFPEWRAKLFTAPDDGLPYQTPKHQFAAFWVMYAMTHKVALPEWVIEYLDEMDPERPLPSNLNELITGGKHLLTFLFLMAPRHGKTDLAIHFTIHTFCKDQNRRILWGNGTIQKSMAFMDNAITWTLENSLELNRLYGPFKADDRPWSQKGIVLAGRTIDTKAYSLQPYGITGNIRSLDADLIVGDDLTDLIRARSELTTEGDYEVITTELMTRREPHTMLMLLGSHVPVMHGDVFTMIEENADRLGIGNHVLIIKKLPAHDYNKCDASGEHVNCLLWPEKRPFPFLEALRGMMQDDTMFEAVFNQVARTKGMHHFPKVLLRGDYIQVPLGEDQKRAWPDPGVEHGALDRELSLRQLPTCCFSKDVLVALGFDPASSEKKGASFTAAIVLGACPYCGRRYLIDWWKDRQSPELHPGTIAMLLRSYEFITDVNIEINAYQSALARDPRVLALELEYRVRVGEWNTDDRKTDPAMGIPMSARHLKNGLMSIPYRGLADQEQAEELIKEFIRWPRKPNDLVMAYWLADVKLEELINDYQETSSQLMPGTEQTPAQEEDTHTVNLDEVDWDAWNTHMSGGL